jgi:hypothetical protein
MNRKFDGRTTASVHELSLATAVLAWEESMPENKRVELALVLFFHERIEDSTAKFPRWLPQRVKMLVREMTFKKGEDKYVAMWKRNKGILLAELWDCTVNLMANRNNPPDKRVKCQRCVRRLLRYIKPKYPNLAIIKLAEALLPPIK